MHEVIDGPPSISTAFAALDVCLQLPPGVPLVLAILHRQRLEPPFGINALAVRIDQIALQPTDHHSGELRVAGEDVSRKPLIIEKFKERGEGLGVTVVRRGCEKQFVLEVWRGQTNQTGPEAFDSVAADSRRDVVSLVDDQQVELPGMADVRGQCVPQKTQAFTLLGPVHRRDETGKRRPRIGVETSLTAQTLDVVRVDDPELESELLLHLDAPLFLQRGRAEHEDRAGAVTQEHLLNDEPCLDGFPEADVVSDQKICARHVDRAHERIQLIVLNADTAAEWRLQIAAIRVRRSPPNHRIQEGLKRGGVIQPGHAR